MVSHIVCILKTPKQSSPLNIRFCYQISISNLTSLKPNSSSIHAHLSSCLIHPSKCSSQKLLIHTGHHDSNPINPNVESPLLITPWFQVTILSPGWTQQPPNWSPRYTFAPSPRLSSTHPIVTLTLLRQKSNHVTPLKTLQSPVHEPTYNPFTILTLSSTATLRLTLLRPNWQYYCFSNTGMFLS